jgi:hypothetical protein
MKPWFLTKRSQALAVHHNSTGFRGVEKRKKGWFRAEIGSKTSKNLRRLGSFKTAKEAALAYDEAARERYGELAYLNFPLNGEKQVKKGDGEFYCPRGHKYSEDGYVSPWDGAKNCHKCNAIAQLRRQARRREGQAA